MDNILSDEEKQKIMDSLNRERPRIVAPTPQEPIDLKQAAINAGVSDAPASSFPMISGMFAPKDAMYKAYGKGGAAPAVPALNRVGGPLDVSPADVVSTVADPLNYVGPGGAMGGIKSIAKKELPNIGYGVFGKLRGMIQNPEVENALSIPAKEALKDAPSALQSVIKLPANHPEMTNLKNTINQLVEEKGLYSPEVQKAQQFYNKKLE